MAPNYLDPKFHDHAFAALRGRFPDRAAFDAWLAAIPSDAERAIFLRVASFYRFLVLEGEYRFDVPEWNEGMDYVNHTYKAIAILALIEASYTEDDFQDFYVWLRGQLKNAATKITAANDLDKARDDYLRLHGSTWKVVRFFGALDARDQQRLGSLLRVGSASPGEPPTAVDRVAKMLFAIRSKFVHEAEFILELGPVLHLSARDRKVVISAMKLDDLQDFFERGLIARFSPARRS